MLSTAYTPRYAHRIHGEPPPSSTNTAASSGVSPTEKIDPIWYPSDIPE